MSLEARVEALERANRRLRVTIAALGLAAAGGIGLGAAQQAGMPEVIRARTVEIVGDNGPSLVLQSSGNGAGEILLRNGKGGISATVSADPGGSGQLALNGRDGQPLIRLSANEFGGTVSTYAPGSKPLAKVGANGVGQGTLSLFSSKGAAPNVTLSGAENGEGMIGTYNAQGQRLIQLSATGSGIGKLVTYTPTGKARVELGSTATGCFIGAFADGNDPIVAMSSTTNGDGLLRTYKADGLPLCGFEVDAQGMPRFAIYGTDGAIAKVMP